MILDQVDLDVIILDLLKKVSEVYDFMKEDEGLEKTPLIQALYGKIARQTLECADFIAHYSETKSACESNVLRRHRLRLNIVSLHRGTTCQGRHCRN
jgi:hypothetical protein